MREENENNAKITLITSYKKKINKAQHVGSELHVDLIRKGQPKIKKTKKKQKKTTQYV